MVSITQKIRFLKSRIKFHDRKARGIGGKNPAAASKHKDTANEYQELIELLEKHPADLENQGKIEDLFSLNPLNLQGIPHDLETELSVSQSDVEDAQILELLKLAGRSLDLNELLIGCFRKYEVKHKRNMLTARIHRLIKRNEMHNVGKGEYALGPAPENNGAEPETSEQEVTGEAKLPEIA